MGSGDLGFTLADDYFKREWSKKPAEWRAGIGAVIIPINWNMVTDASGQGLKQVMVFCHS
jgi:hypothetical protein